MGKQQLNQMQAATLLKCSQQTVCRYCLPPGHKYRRIPRPAMMERIRIATGGQVTANDFYPGAPGLSGAGDGGTGVVAASSASPTPERISTVPINRRSAAARKAARTTRRMREARASHD